MIQAGGNVGLYALWFAHYFQKVVTFEPDPANWACLVRNIEGLDGFARIDARHAAIGDAEGQCAVIEVEAGNCGAHRVNATEKGAIRMLTIDSLNLNACDGIFLDIEGYELQALRGAIKTIEQFSPVIALEMKRLADVYGYSDQDTHDFLTGMGYDQASSCGNDRLYVRT